MLYSARFAEIFAIPMEMISCPNCNKLTGYKRALGFGTFFAVALTLGLWLLFLPFYPKRCIGCGLSKAATLPWYSQTRYFVGFLVLAALLVGILMGRGRPDLPAPVFKGPDYNEAPRRGSAVAEAANPAPLSPFTESHTDDHQLRLLPSPSGIAAISDGRTYSVAVIAKYAHDIPTDTELFAQGNLAAFEFAEAFVQDEEEADKNLVCLMSEDESAQVKSLYHVGEAVQVMGNYAATTTDNMPIIRNCHVAGPTSDVVRPHDTD